MLKVTILFIFFFLETFSNSCGVGKKEIDFNVPLIKCSRQFIILFITSNNKEMTYNETYLFTFCNAEEDECQVRVLASCSMVGGFSLVFVKCSIFLILPTKWMPEPLVNLIQSLLQPFFRDFR